MAIPRFTAEEALELARSGFGMANAERAEPLPSYDDQNWRVVRHDGLALGVVKLSASGATCRGGAGCEETLDVLELEHEAMRRWRAQGVLCPEPIPAKWAPSAAEAGETSSERIAMKFGAVKALSATVLRVDKANGGDGVNLVRAITYLRGEHLSKFVVPSPSSPLSPSSSLLTSPPPPSAGRGLPDGRALAALRGVGAACALGLAALAGWDPVAGRRAGPWDLAHAHGALRHARHLSDAAEGLALGSPSGLGGGEGGSEGGGAPSTLGSSPQQQQAPLSDRALVVGWLERFRARLDRDSARFGGTLPEQLVHNDLNDYNILVDATALAAGGVDGEACGGGSGGTSDAGVAGGGGAGGGLHPLCAGIGILDFGDAVWTARVFDLAICLAYACQPFGADPDATLAAARAVLAGFKAASVAAAATTTTTTLTATAAMLTTTAAGEPSVAGPRDGGLTAREAAVLPLAVGARLCVSLLMSAGGGAVAGAEGAEVDEATAAYRKVSEAPGWRLLRTWKALDDAGRLGALVGLESW